jgi:hypothetical protein
MSEAVTIERLERGFALCAYRVGLDGPVAVPLFESLERELTAIRDPRHHGSREAVAGILQGWGTSSFPQARLSGSQNLV